MNDMEYFFSFLKPINPKAEELAQIVEDKYYSKETDFALLNARKMIEAIVNEWLEVSGLQNTYNLNDNIRLLQSEEIIDRELASDLHYVRRNGNSAAHELFTKEAHEILPKIWSSLYNIVESYVLSYENPPSIPRYAPPTHPAEKSNDRGHDDILKILEAQLEEKLKALSSVSPKEQPTEEIIVEKKESNKLFDFLPQIEKDNESYLYNLMSRLNESSKEAVESAELPLSSLKQYLHVERPIENRLIQMLQQPAQKRLTLLIGSVGDGKSHILSHLQSAEPELMNRYKNKIWNDATESLSPRKTAMETLLEKLIPFSDQHLHEGSEEFVLAINLGVLHKFLYDFASSLDNQYTFNSLISYIEQSGIFENEISQAMQHDHFSMVSFSDYPMYELTKGGVESNFLMSILSKMFDPNEENPFYLAYQEDVKRGIDSIIHRNFLLMGNQQMRRNFVNIIASSLLKEKAVLSMRQFFNLIYEIMIPGNWTNISKQKIVLETLLIHGLHQKIFTAQNDSPISIMLRNEDPVASRSEEIDQIILQINLESDVSGFISRFDELTRQTYELDLLDRELVTEYTQSLLRLLYLSNPREMNITQTTVESFSKYLFAYYTGQKYELKTLYEKFENALMLWFGFKKDQKKYLFDTNAKISKRYRIAKPVSFTLDPISMAIKNEEQVVQFRNSLFIQFAVGERKQRIKLEIDYKMFSLISKIDQGYQPSKIDFDDAIRFSEFANAIRTHNTNNEEVLIYVVQTGETFVLKQEADPFSNEEKIVFNKL
ncbi:DNA phosphorothioation-dependent restriction protein DptF [Exiguobacterium aestuarii]|uniref:DNA phosphorothioation-dependent restriction protein DptF n=1 Tax=Exiguobacterium aestuarii TaxID=273527 RepID=A0ABW2PLX7_9BACL|nr:MULTISPECIES: DNA phosphorothioation-dependent restriction protein DptF [Exiguobacterium]MCT4784771.1 DNA phosphorothioation-dependent restriction protein DptF [Exiguobacterium aestuarii]